MKRKGFTLIELLVVIAIIGILATIVLASLNSARTKGSDAAITSNLDHARTAASLYFDDHSQSYAGVCTDASGIAPMSTGAVAAGSPSAPICNDAATAWAMEAQMKTVPTDYWCTDSTGASYKTATVLVAGGDTFCTQS